MDSRFLRGRRHVARGCLDQLGAPLKVITFIQLLADRHRQGGPLQSPSHAIMLCAQGQAPLGLAQPPCLPVSAARRPVLRTRPHHKIHDRNVAARRLRHADSLATRQPAPMLCPAAAASTREWWRVNGGATAPPMSHMALHSPGLSRWRAVRAGPHGRTHRARLPPQRALTCAASCARTSGSGAPRHPLVAAARACAAASRRARGR